jgi:23S rRNA pseudouridine1911/1915/1917 synthase
MVILVTPEAAGQRLDVYAVAEIKQLSRSSVRQLIDEGKVLVNGKQVKSGYKVRANEEIDIDYDLKELEQIPEIDLPVIYEDDDCLVVIKPAGILTHSKGAFNPEATVGTFIAPKLSGLSGDRAGIVHRLDRATSGIIICAKNEDAMTWLQKQFSQRKVKKTYYAVIEGTLEPKEAVIEVPIERNPRDPKTFKPGLSGKPAVTRYKVVETVNGKSLVELSPTTGRTHQLRVHLKYLEHPILGDTIYEGAPADRMYLHAERLELTLPNKERKVFEASLPPEFRAILSA